MAPTAITPPSSIDNADDVQKLSPFVVKTSADDIGYYAENTLAGSRINTKIGDLAASITVVTRQQMLDTASTDMNDIFLYEANTEGTKNYNAFSFNDTGGVSDTNATTPSTANRLRGIGAVDRGHNYYPSLPGLPFDVYNTETVEINRGPNSLLFGLGNPAGIVNQSSSSANLTRRTAEVTLRYGSEDSYRTSFRINQPLIPRKLAVFVAGLYSSNGFERKPSYDISRRGYVSIKYAPFAKTSIQASYERYSGSARIPNTVTPQDGITEWRAAGSPSWDPLTFTYTKGGVATKLANNTALANVSGLSVTRFPSINLYYDRSGPLLWMAQAQSAGIAGGATATLPELADSSPTLEKLSASSLPLYRVLGLSDHSIYDWSAINAASGNASREHADVYNVDVDQELLPSLFVKAGWYREDFTRYQSFYNVQQMIRIDPNINFADGTTNPYFNRPFFATNNPADSYKPQRNDNYRLSLAYRLDFSKKSGWQKWLGAHQLFAIGSRQEVTAWTRASNEVVTDAHSWIPAGAARFSGGPSQVAVSTSMVSRFYLGGRDGNVSYDPGLFLHGPFDISARYSVRNADGTYTWINDPVHLDQSYNFNTNITKQTTDSLTLGLQSSLLNDRVVPTVGFRRDKNLSQTTNRLTVDPATGFLNLSGLTENNFAPARAIFGNTRTAGVVVKPLSWLSFTYNQSRNFVPASLGIDIFGHIQPNPSGQGKDYGVRFNFWNNKLTFGVNFFKANSVNSRTGPTSAPIFRINSIFEPDFINWATVGARRTLGASASADAINTEVARITKLPAGYIPEVTNVVTTNTVDAKGLEAQVIFNPVRNWNIKATVGQQRAVYSNISPEYDQYITARLPVLIAAKDENGASYWNSPGLSGAPVGASRTPSAYWLQVVDSPVRLARVLQGKRTQGQRDWQANLISTYRFVEGPLKGTQFGGGVRWQDRAIIGYLGTAADSDGVVRSLDASKPVFDNPRPAVDVWISREFALPKLFGEGTHVQVQLNVRDAFERGDRLVALAINPDGTTNTYRIVDTRTWYLTGTFKF